MKFNKELEYEFNEPHKCLSMNPIGFHTCPNMNLMKINNCQDMNSMGSKR